MIYLYSCLQILRIFYHHIKTKLTWVRERKKSDIEMKYIYQHVYLEGNFLSIDCCQRETDGRIVDEKYTRIYRIKKTIENNISAHAIASIAIKSRF